MTNNFINKLLIDPLDINDPDNKDKRNFKNINELAMKNIQIAMKYKDLKGHNNEVFSVVFSKCGLLFASCSKDKTVKLWESTSGKLINSIDGHHNVISSCCFTPCSK